MLSQRDAAAPRAALPRRSAIGFIVLVGVVSLFADMTYEGARSITGPYLASLGASAAVVGLVAGGGELLGYAIRLLSGYLSDRTGRYWAITIAGYAINLLAVPLIALADRWEIAAALIVAERAGRGIRTPARDAMLSHAASQTGLGWGFGLHEALDQIGAVLGPLIVSAVLYFRGGYEAGFAVLAIPALLALAVLAAACRLYPRPRELDLAPSKLTAERLPRLFWAYLAGAACIGAGFVDFPLIAYHFEKASIVAPAWIPVLFAVAMAADALAALVLGRLFDRIGMWTVFLATFLSLFAAPLAFFGGFGGAVAAMILWGVGMGAQESVMRAAIAPLAPADRRGTVYGIFHTVYGIAWFAGSALLGILYDEAVLALVIASVWMQALALPILWWVARRARGGTRAAPIREQEAEPRQ
jgi:MFS family permease